ncbi:glycosyltransferase [Gluconacetobacter sacchari]|uniref:Glycosyltransferase n=2 Tax=Gluconacetobacter sacchari TaxID=92759 RepID=A0A7W4ICQ0_9PROT|nr:glycosyltransferase [Gluconacetobacter sacchari]MBB2160327.1 glycosyltransferase [Gluconacetobacter sacchari]GBQ27625.1 dolichol-phosphate mannosyltransferase [Gluconacetobacter sacchari DSM 12717]
MNAGLSRGPAGPACEAGATAADVSIVVPCYNERANVRPMVAALSQALAGREWEVIFVDDNSPDGTIDEVRALAEQDGRVRGVLRVGRRGLSSAVIEGVLSSSARIVAVMDGDMQHDESCLGQLIDAVARDGYDIAVGSRHVAGGDNAGLASGWRTFLSDSGIRIVQMILPVRLGDPMSGFFAMRRDLFERTVPRLSGTGFKILLDVFLSAPQRPRVLEVPFVFRPRAAGESKLDVLVLLQFAAMLGDKLCRGFLPIRFIGFGLVGLIGILVNLAVLEIGRRCGTDFATGQWLGTLVAMVTNFWMNNALTYRDRRLRGMRMWLGLGLFMVICAAGAVADVGIARAIFSSDGQWGLASMAGAAIAVVWNYAVSSTLIWRVR